MAPLANPDPPLACFSAPSDPPDEVVPVVPVVPAVTTFTIATFKHDAEVTWRRFLACMGKLPPDQQRQLWRQAQAQAEAATAAIDLPVDLPTQCPHKSLESQIIP